MARPQATITATHTVHVRRSPADVYDYTQNYSTRTVWDRSITSVEKLADSPRRYRLAIRGSGRFVIEYRLDRRGERTSAAFTEAQSLLFSGGGGSWSYEPNGDGTDWSTTNTLELKHRFLGRLLGPTIRRQLLASMRESMAEAKRIMESGDAANT